MATTNNTNRKGEKAMTNEEQQVVEAQAQMDKLVINGHKVGDMRGIFSKMQDRTHWQRPFQALVLIEDRELAVEAAIFFHGCVPAVRRFNSKYLAIFSPGYACD